METISSQNMSDSANNLKEILSSAFEICNSACLDGLCIILSRIDFGYSYSQNLPNSAKFWGPYNSQISFRIVSTFGLNLIPSVSYINLLDFEFFSPKNPISFINLIEFSMLIINLYDLKFFPLSLIFLSLILERIPNLNNKLWTW